MPTLYVTEPGSRIEKEYGRLLVTRDDQVLTSVALAHVSEVVLVGGVGATTAAMLALLDAGCGLTLVSAQGKLRGRLRPLEGGALGVRKAQYRATDDPAFALALSRGIVRGKVRNSRTIARRLLRGGASPGAAPAAEDDTFNRFKAALTDLDQAATLDALRGVEGRVARVYFEVLRSRLKAGLAFGARTRRPPRDPVNALLSLAYSLLGQAMLTAVEVAGLDPFAGFLHADRPGRPALVLDLVEEFRPVVADSVVLTVVNKGMVAADDFETDEGGGVWLKRPALRTFLGQFARRLRTEVHHPLAGRALSYQKVFEVQARALRRCIETGDPDYHAFEVR
jgi:CRISPR-associated protein Cas1